MGKRWGWKRKGGKGIETYGTFLVTPGQLRQRAEEWKQTAIQLKKELGCIGELSEGTQDCLKGNAGGRLKDQFDHGIRRGTEGVEAMERLGERLLLIAEEYEKAEKENSNVHAGN